MKMFEEIWFETGKYWDDATFKKDNVINIIYINLLLIYSYLFGIDSIQ